MPAGVGSRRSRARPGCLTRISPVRVVRNGPAPVRLLEGSVTAALTRPAFGARSRSGAPPRRPRGRGACAAGLRDPEPRRRAAIRQAIDVEEGERAPARARCLVAAEVLIKL